MAIRQPWHSSITLSLLLCGLLVLVFNSWMSCIPGYKNWIGSQLSFCLTLEILHFSCEIKQDVQSANCGTFLSDMVIYFETVIFLSGDHLPEILYPYSKKVSSIHVMPSTWEKYEVLSPVPLRLSCILALLYELCLYLSLAAPQTLLLRVEWICLQRVHCVHTHVEPLQICSLKMQRHKEGSENILWNGRYKRTNNHRIKEVPTFAFEPKFDTFDQRVEVEISHSTLFPEIFVLIIQILHSSLYLKKKVTHIYDSFSVWFINNFPLCPFFKI